MTLVSSFSNINSITFEAKVGKLYVVIGNVISSDTGPTATLNKMDGGNILAQQGFKYAPAGGWTGTAHVSCVMAIDTSISITYNTSLHTILVYEIAANTTLSATLLANYGSSSSISFDCEKEHLYIIVSCGMGNYATISNINGGIATVIKNISYTPYGGWTSGVAILGLYATSNSIQINFGNTPQRVHVFDIY